MERQGFTAYSVPTENQKVLIQRNGNVAIDVTDNIHPRIAATATLAARVVGLDIAGVDLVVEDISRPLEEQRGAIVEVNAGPGLLAHLKPAGGKPRPVGAAIVEHLFASDTSGRIPIVGVTGSRDTTLIARLIAWLVHISGKHVGLACSEGLYLDRRQVAKGNCANWEAGQRLLINRSVEAAIFENGSRMILSEGLAYDKCMVGVVTDVSLNQDLSEFYIGELDQVYSVLRTQVDVILPSGVAVLNAADPQVVEMAALCDGNVIFYGLDRELNAISKHSANGERSVFLCDNNIILAEADKETSLMPISIVEAGLTHHPESVLAAVAAAWALGTAPQLIIAGLKTFGSSPKI